MPQLNDTQTILLSTAAQRDDRSLYPLPASLNAGAHISKAVAALIAANFAEERDTNVAKAIFRRDGDLSFGAFATAAGLAAIGIELEVGNDSTVMPEPAAPRATKAAAVLALLRRDEGATLPDLIAATGWLPHTTRAALTGLRKRGHAITKTKRDGVTCYRIDAA